MSKPSSNQCRAQEEGHTAIRHGKRVVVSRRCARRTRNDNGCCWQHQQWAEQHPEKVAETTTREIRF